MNEFDEIADLEGRDAGGVEGIVRQTPALRPRVQTEAENGVSGQEVGLTASRPSRSANKKKAKKTIDTSGPVARATCPRWMHHRTGVYCKACGKTP